MDQISSEPAEEREDDMSSLADGFSARMHKRVASVQGESTPGSEVPGGKRPKQSGLGDAVQRSPMVVTLDSLEQASDALPTLVGSVPKMLPGRLVHHRRMGLQPEDLPMLIKL